MLFGVKRVANVESEGSSTGNLAWLRDFPEEEIRRGGLRGWFLGKASICGTLLSADNGIA